MRLKDWIHRDARERRSEPQARARGRYVWPVACAPGSNRARGAAIVEFAVVLPLLLTILFGIIEYGWVFSVRQTLQTAAREGTRVAILQTSATPYTAVLNRVAKLMQPTGLTSYTITMTHASQADPVETINVTIPYNDVSLMGGFFGTHSYNLIGSCSMRKEGM